MHLSACYWDTAPSPLPNWYMLSHIHPWFLLTLFQSSTFEPGSASSCDWDAMYQEMLTIEAEEDDMRRLMETDKVFERIS